MPSYQLPSIYLGSGGEGEALYDKVIESQAANTDRFPSVNKFLAHLIRFAIDNDKSLKVDKAA